ncbi:hypothetical protein [Streptomyces sp.]|uniref:hypothetical protein n=1 Tax=Streptomyces sp. TaxID=1931 RepID=UPI002D78B6B5|nr:hypothetical protein [Streptomyces sp.]HET6358129.1 hypothetical protein [Streptomyces sp.]
MAELSSELRTVRHTAEVVRRIAGITPSAHWQGFPLNADALDLAESNHQRRHIQRERHG